MNVVVASAQTTQAASASDPLGLLPSSDVVAFVDIKRVLTEISPRILAKDPATLAKMTTALNDLNNKTGINLLAIDRIAVGVQFVGAVKRNLNKNDVGVAIIAHGDFNVDKFIAFIESEMKGKGRHETYGGKLIHIEPAPKPTEKKSERETGALTFLDAHTIVVGDLPQVRATIDAAATGKGRVDPLLLQLATQDATTLIGLAGNMPPSVAQELSASATPGDEGEEAIAKVVANIRQVFLSITPTPTAFNAIVGARMGSAEQAQSMVDLLFGIRQQTVPYIEDKTARDLLNSVQINAVGDQVRLSDSIPNEVVESFAASLIKESQPDSKSNAKTTVTKKTTTTKRLTTKHRKARHSGTKHRRTRRRTTQ
jgi:hypothetical protein